MSAASMFLLSDDYWQVKNTKEKGRGVFAKKRVLAGTVIGDYLGKVIHIADYDPVIEKGMYLMYFSDRAFIYPDLSVPGIHLLNHSCIPNCWMYIYQGHTLFFALRTIEAGGEFTISYLLSPKDNTCSPCMHICKCGSLICTGTMHLTPEKYARWQRFQIMERKKTKNSPFTIGQDLSRLPSYPEKIPANRIYATIMAP